MRDNESGVSWQSGVVATEEGCLLGIEHHLFGNGAASVKGSQPIIIVLARKMYKVIPDELKEPLAQNRLLIISVSTAIRQSKMTAMTRNRYVCEMADRILFVGVTEQSSLYPYKNEYRNKLEKNI